MSAFVKVLYAASLCLVLIVSPFSADLLSLQVPTLLAQDDTDSGTPTYLPLITIGQADREAPSSEPLPGTAGFAEADAASPLAIAASSPLNKFRSFNLHGGYAAAGAGMRNRGYGTISVAGIPEGSTVKGAYLYWDILANGDDPAFANVKINGQPVSGFYVGAGGDPCWGNTNNFSYRADVTSLVTGNGAYAVSGLASGITDGTDPWSSKAAPMAEGASLIVIYENLASPHVQILVYNGSYRASSAPAALTIDGFTAPSPVTKATTTFVGADGQDAADTGSRFNGSPLPSVGWDGDDPQDGPDYSHGNLWDTMTVDVTPLVAARSKSATATVEESGDCLVWVAQVFSIETGSGPIDVNISLYANPATVAERKPYEEMVGYFADGVFEESNGAHRLGKVTFYTKNAHLGESHIAWVEKCHPNANPSGYREGGDSILHINMCDVFVDPKTSAVILNHMEDDTAWKAGGYTLAHEWGHYFYSLYDEYKGDSGQSDDLALPRSTDKAVEPSIMNQQTNAICTWRWLNPCLPFVNNRYEWLNFSTEKNDTHETAQNRVYAASAWETLTRPLSMDPCPNSLVAQTRLYHPELASVAPGPGEDPRIDLQESANPRSALTVTWETGAVTATAAVVDGALTAVDQSGIPITAEVLSLDGEDIVYPDPVLLLAYAQTTLPIADLEIDAIVTRPGGATSELAFADDGVAPDVVGDDGLYSAILPYTSNGTYSVAVDFNNNAGNARFVSTAFLPSAGPGGEPIAMPSATPVGVNFHLTQTLEIYVAGVLSDDHGDTPQTATIIENNGMRVAGRIDRAGDKDVFLFTVIDGHPTYVRVTELALGMQPQLEIVTASGDTVSYAPTFASDGYLVGLLPDLPANTPLYAILTHVDDQSSGGLYRFSVGSALHSDFTWHMMNVAQVGNGSGTVTSTPDGIVCNPICQDEYTSSTVVTLTATAEVGSTFVGWGGACTGSGSCALAMGATQAVTATFQLKTYSLQVTKDGNGEGTVVSTPGGVNCGSSCEAKYNHGTVVTLTATAEVGSTFEGWGGACTGSGSCMVTATSPVTISASFSRSRVYIPIVTR